MDDFQIQESADFKDFALKHFDIHYQELQTKYNNQPVESNDTLLAGYKAHLKMFGEEMDQEIHRLLPDNDPWKSTILEELKQKALQDLKDKMPAPGRQ